jgi:hypothetical protein
MKPIFEFRQSLNLIPPAETEFWIALTAQPKQTGNAYVLGRKCKTLAEFESVAAEIQADLQRAIAEAREKLGSFRQRGETLTAPD